MVSPEEAKLLRSLARILQSKPQASSQTTANNDPIPTIAPAKCRYSAGDVRVETATETPEQTYSVSLAEFTTLFSSSLEVIAGSRMKDATTFTAEQVQALPAIASYLKAQEDAVIRLHNIFERLQKHVDRFCGDAEEEADKSDADTSKVSKSMSASTSSQGSEKAKETEPKEDQKESTSKAAVECKFAKLPKETMAKIFRYARGSLDGQNHVPKKTQKGRQPSASAKAAQTPSTPSMTAQVWLLSMRLVCKDWSPVVQSVVWGRLTINTDKILDGVLRAIKNKPDLANLISESAVIRMVPSARGTGHPEIDWEYPASTAMITGNSDNVDKTPEAKVARLVDAAKALQMLKLITNPKNTYTHRPIAYLPIALHESLCGSALKHLILDQCIVYADLELILLRLKTLTTLVLEAGIDSVDGRDDIASEEHENHFKHLKIRCIGGARLGIRQLEWIVRPSIGHMKVLELKLPTRTLSTDDDDLDDAGFQENHLAFTSAAFANLLVQLAPTLRVLDFSSSRSGTVIVNDNLSVAPHQGSFDYAIGLCTQLRKIHLPWSTTSTGFLSALSRSPNITEINMVGNATRTSAKDFIKHIEDGLFPRLNKITLADFHTAMTSEGWNARDMRALLLFMAQRKIELLFQ